MAEQRTLDAEREFEAWWESDGQYIRAGGGQYEKSFAYAAWLAARRAPPALDTEGLPPLIWGDDLEAWLEVRDEAEIVAAIRAAQRHAYDAGQQSQAARIQHLTHERDLALAAARQSAPEGAPVVKIQRGRVWIVRGNQSFMLAYEADDDEPENVEWYASKLRSAIGCFTPGVKVEGAPVGMEVVALNEMRIALTVQIDELTDIASAYEVKMEHTGDFDEARRIRGAVAYARKVAAPYKYNGPLRTEATVVCERCNGSGTAKLGAVLGWGIATPDMPCRHCLGKGKLAAPTSASAQPPEGVEHASHNKENSNE